MVHVIEQDVLQPAPVGGHQLVNRARHPYAGRDEHDDEVADAFQVRDEMRGEHDAHAVLGGDFGDRAHELAPRQRVEARHRLVEDEQLRPFRHGQGQGELGALAAGELAGSLAAVEAECRDPAVGEAAIPARVQPRAEAQMVRDGQVRIRRCVLGDESDPGKVVRALGGAPSEHFDRACRRVGESDRQTHQRGLAGAVRADEPDHPPGRYGQRAVGQRPPPAVPLAEAASRQHSVIGHGETLYAGGGHSPVTESVTVR